MKSRKSLAGLVVTTAVLAIATESSFAQGRGSNAGRPAGGAAANVADRVQGQINQRVQAQMQQRVQAQTQVQVQSRVQGRMLNRIQAESMRAAAVAKRAAEDSIGRAGQPGDRNARGSAAAARANERSGLQGRNAIEGSNGRASVGLGVAANASRNEWLNEADLAIYDNIFGNFNPLRARAKNVPGGDVARGIQVAARQRRAEIAQLRDQAIATGQTDLLVRADEMEQRLDAFVAAQQQLERGRSGQVVPDRTATRLNGSAATPTRIQN